MYRWLPALLILTSCGVYNSKFDCPPGRGIGCAPVHEVLDLIVEREKGEDLFVDDKGTALLLKEEEKSIRSTRISKKKLVLIRDENGQFRLAKMPEEKPS